MMILSKHRIQAIRLMLCRNARSRAKYAKKKGILATQGENCYFWTWRFGTEPYLISIGDNVSIAANVSFINHDVSNIVFNNLPENAQGGVKYQERKGPIAIGNNVFIGAGTRILYDVKIGNNVIIGAGSLVNRDIPDGTVAAGVPCRVVGKFEDYGKKLLSKQER